MNADAPTLELVLGALRRSGDEAQVTQLIAAFAAGDSRFAAGLARILVEQAPFRDRFGLVPDELSCTAESHLITGKDSDLGYVDLRFENPTAGFTLFVELKIHAGYGQRQLERYLDALDDLPGGDSALLAVTSHLPRHGEEAVGDHPKWLGSLRWSSVYDELAILQHRDPTANEIWPALLKLIREQGDFGLMDFDPDAVRGWSRWKEGRSTLIALLEEIHEPALEIVRRRLGEAKGVEPSEELATYVLFNDHRLVWPWGESINLQIAVPADNSERLRIQVAGGREIPVLTTEARHEDARPLLRSGEPKLLASTEALREEGFGDPGYDYGSYWSRPHPPEGWLTKGSGIREAMLELIESDLEALIRSGILEALPPSEPGATVATRPEE